MLLSCFSTRWCTRVCPGWISHVTERSGRYVKSCKSCLNFYPTVYLCTLFPLSFIVFPLSRSSCQINLHRSSVCFKRAFFLSILQH